MPTSLRRAVLCLAAIHITASAAIAETVAKRVLRTGADRGRQLLANPGFEEAAAARAGGWDFWDRGYERTATERRAGTGAIVCSLRETNIERGAGQVVVLDQKRPQPIVAVGWSKAVGVSGSPNADYSLYLDILYQDDTPLWGQVATFDTGTHGWQRRERLVVPDKPIKQVSVHAIFRRHTGTAYFDDFALYELSAKSGTCLFDGTPVHAPSKTPSVSPGDSVALRTGDGLALMVSKSQGAVFLGGSETGRGGFMVRDAAAGSDICWVDANVRVADGGATLKGGVESLAIELEAELRAERDHIRVDGLVSSTRAEDRALSFYFVLPFRASGGRWYDDVRTERAIEPNTRYQHTTYVGAGTNQQMSPYPLSCVATPDRALCLGIPMDEPRLFRLGYDSAWHEHYLAFDFGLASEP